MNASTTSLRSQIETIIKGKGSKAAKKADLIKIGIKERDFDLLFALYGEKKNIVAFDASKLTFGVEIECFNVIPSRLISEVRSRNIEIQHEGYNHRDNNHYYKLVSDSSILGNNPIECVSPILKGAAGKKSLEDVCDSLNAIDARVNKSTGLHIHVDAQKISDAHFRRIIINYALLEDVIDLFLAPSRRGNSCCWCASMRRYCDNLPQTKSEIIRHIGTRYTKVNVEAYLRHKTIEFRQHQGTTDYKKISMWLTFIQKLIQYSYDKTITDNIYSISEIPFLTNAEKAYFERRANELR